MTLRIGSLCTGYGGLDLAAAAWFGGRTVWTSDIDPGARKIIAHRYPHAPNLGDLTAIDWSILVGRTPDFAGTQRMYDLYCQGHSLAEVAQREGVTRQTVYTRFLRRGLSMRARPAAKPHLDYEGRRYTMGAQGYYRATEGDRGYLHRDMWAREVGLIPDGFDIHHVNHDKTDNRVSNFECLSHSDHARLYNLGCNQFGHQCQGGGAPDSFAVDVLTAGYP